MASSSIKTKVTGHVLIKDSLTNEVLLDKFNAVHNKNMALAIARCLSNEANGVIYRLKLGNGGSSVNGTNEITYAAPNITGAATLYNETYDEIIDDAAVGVPVDNSVTSQPNADPLTTAIVICTATIAAGEPSGQGSSDTPPNSNPEAQFAFDELGLFTEDNKLLTHIIFSPILKTGNRELVISYTLTVQVS